MNKIKSFQIDHQILQRGLYLSRLDTFDGFDVSTFDIRICKPYEDEPLDAAAIHTIEHLGATFLRTMSNVSNKVIYFGPMGCQTGFYLVLSGKHESCSILGSVKEMFKYIMSYEGPIPGATEQECGNCYLNNLPKARQIAFKFFNDVLSRPSVKNLYYPGQTH